jgi:prepilin-type N-terminal cleavage/methylation domain-containing protein
MNLKFQISNRRAFTLLEVILAMALAVIVIAAVGTAVHVNLRAFDSGRRDVEEARLAHALLRRIADDIRGAVQYDPQRADEILEAATSGSSTSSAAEDAAQAAEEAGVDSQTVEQVASTVSQYASNLAESTTLPPVAGLYGNRYELQVDVSRLPRIDQLGQSVVPTADGTSVDRVSDMKTVTYYVVGLGGAVGGPSLGGAQAGGLIRRELDRAVTAFAAETGSLSSIDLNLSPIAPEVVGIEFWYTDGSQWYEYWDSVEQQGLPVAIEVTLYIAQPQSSSRGLFGLGGGSDLQMLDNARTYKTVVHIPSARPPKITTESESTEETSSSDSSSTSSGTSSSGSSGTGSSGNGGSGAGTGGTSGTGSGNTTGR